MRMFVALAHAVGKQMFSCGYRPCRPIPVLFAPRHAESHGFWEMVCRPDEKYTGGAMPTTPEMSPFVKA